MGGEFWVCTHCSCHFESSRAACRTPTNDQKAAPRVAWATSPCAAVLRGIGRYAGHSAKSTAISLIKARSTLRSCWFDRRTDRNRGVPRTWAGSPCHVFRAGIPKDLDCASGRPDTSAYLRMTSRLTELSYFPLTRQSMGLAIHAKSVEISRRWVRL